MRARLLALAIIAAAPAAAGAGGGRHAVRYLMGTWCDLTLLGDQRGDAAAEAAFQEIARLERILSVWDEDSEISRLNRNAGRGPQPVSLDLARVVREAEDLCASTGGAFDPSVGSLVHAWGFDTDSPRRPSARRAR